MANIDELKLTERQWEYIKALQDTFHCLWLGAVNKKVVDALVKKRLVKISMGKYVYLTKLGKSYLKQ